MAALSFRVHSATTLALISFIYSMKAFRGFFICGFLSSSFFGGTGDFLACIEALMLSLWGSCLIAGETMAGWGMPV